MTDPIEKRLTKMARLWVNENYSALLSLANNDVAPLIPLLQQAMAMGADAERKRNEELVKFLSASGHALRSYEFGNSEADLAKRIADAIDAVLLNN